MPARAFNSLLLRRPLAVLGADPTAREDTFTLDVVYIRLDQANRWASSLLGRFLILQQTHDRPSSAWIGNCRGVRPRPRRAFNTAKVGREPSIFCGGEREGEINGPGRKRRIHVDDLEMASFKDSASSVSKLGLMFWPLAWAPARRTSRR